MFMGFSRQEYWSGLPFPYPGDLPNPGIEARSPELQADSLLSEPSGKPRVYFFNFLKWRIGYKILNMTKLTNPTFCCFFYAAFQPLSTDLWDTHPRSWTLACCCSVAKLCLTLCNSTNYSPQGFSVHGISQARILEEWSFPSQGIILMQGSKPRLLHFRQILHHWVTMEASMSLSLA